MGKTTGNDEIDEAALFEERIEAAYLKWDEWLLEHGDLDILTMGDWEQTEGHSSTIQRVFSHTIDDEYYGTDEDMSDKNMIENTFFVRFKRNTAEVVSWETAERLT